MNWHPVKTILLLLLLAANLFLLGTAAGGRIEEERQYAESAQSAAALLAENGIEVDASLLAPRDAMPRSYSFTAARTDLYCSAAALLLGQSPNAVFLLPDGLQAETASGASVRLSFDGRVLLPATADDAAFPAEFAAMPEERNAFAEELRVIREKTALSESELVPLGYAEANGVTYLNCRRMLDGLPVCGCDCVFGVSDGRLTAARGSLFFAGGEKTAAAAPCLDRVNIMLSELRRGETGAVRRITPCYAVYESAEKDKTFAYPAYEIVYEDEAGTRSVCVCALNGER